MPTRPDTLHWLALEAIPGLGPDTARQLLEHFPDIRTLFSASASSLKALAGERMATAIAKDIDAAAHAATLAWLEAPDAHLLTWLDPDYPPQLKALPGAPAWLYVKGNPAVLSQPMLGIVGSRNATPQGKRDAQAFAQALSEAGLTIISGLAEGIDTAAHEGGLAGNNSGVAVVGTGLDRVYPAKNRQLAHRLASGGALISEFPLGTPPRPGHFPRRNRLISGLAVGVLIVEAAPQSGSLITARLAAEQGREVFAMPGSIHSPLAKGCHQLIKEGAKLVESAADILEELRWQWTPIEQDHSTSPDSGLLAHLGSEPVGLDALVASSGLTVDRLSAMLLALELEGRVAQIPGGLYQRLF